MLKLKHYNMLELCGNKNKNKNKNRKKIYRAEEAFALSYSMICLNLQYSLDLIKKLLMNMEMFERENPH